VSDKYPVSIVICALNEEKSIQKTIESARKNNPFEIIVVEGGSTDKTYEIAKRYTDKAFSVDIYGLGYKRAYGVNKASCEYIMTLDSDQVLEENALEVMIKELEDNNFVGLQATLKSIKNETYWEDAMEYNVSDMVMTEPQKTFTLGTPALYKASILKSNNFDETISGSCDDTDLAYRLSKQNYKLGISTAICYQKHRSTFKSTLKKFMWYGEGDCEFGLKHKERLWSIFSHPIKNYFFRKSFYALNNGDIKFVPFFMFTGIARHIGFYKFLLKRLFGNTKDSRVANRDDMEF
jgi:glycosyltransferase involved in cell wall biosynthesis